jgi:ATP-dependent DNA helicase PIF1
MNNFEELSKSIHVTNQVKSIFNALNSKQADALNLMLQGKNVFLTGPAGTGKTYIIHLLKKLSNKKIALTGTTGVSAIMIGGTTLHSYTGIGLGNGTAEYLANKIMKSSYLRDRYTKLEVLIIDEVSMLSPDLFDKIEHIFRIVRRGHNDSLLVKNVEELPFGGVQIVLCGDFLQLPVVGEDKFCFESKQWNRCVDKTIYLNEIIRQIDPQFQDVLNNLRQGIVSPEVRKMLEERINVELVNDLNIKPTRIFTTNADVDIINDEELTNLGQYDPTLQYYQYDMEINFHAYNNKKRVLIDKYKKSCLAPDELLLCIGAQVMLLCNLDVENGLVNGSRGIVINFLDGDHELPVVKFLNGQERMIDYHDWEIEEDGKKLVKITQIPLKLAWAITTHKSQGLTLDYAEVDLKRIFAYGLAYVALSRVKTISGLKIIDIDFENIKAHPKALQFYKSYSSNKIE